MRPTAAAASAVVSTTPLIPQPEIKAEESVDEGETNEEHQSRVMELKTPNKTNSFSEQQETVQVSSASTTAASQQIQFPMNTAELLAACSNTAGLNFNPGSSSPSPSPSIVMPPNTTTTQSATTAAEPGIIEFNASTSAQHVRLMLLAAGFGQKPPKLSEETLRLWKELEEFVSIRWQAILLEEVGCPEAPGPDEVALMQLQVVQKLRETLPKDRNLLYCVQQNHWMQLLLEWLNLHDRPNVQVEALFALTSIADLCQQSFNQQQQQITGSGGIGGMNPIPTGPSPNNLNIHHQQQQQQQQQSNHGSEKATSSFPLPSSSSQQQQGSMAGAFPGGQNPFYMNPGGYPCMAYERGQNHSMAKNETGGQMSWNGVPHGGVFSNFMNLPQGNDNNISNNNNNNSTQSSDHIQQSENGQSSIPVITKEKLGNGTPANEENCSPSVTCTNPLHKVLASSQQPVQTANNDKMPQLMSPFPNTSNHGQTGQQQQQQPMGPMSLMPSAPITPAMVAAAFTSGIALPQQPPSSLPPPAAPPGSAPIFGNYPQPLSESSQHLLLRNADTIPTLVSLLSSPNREVHEQAMWILGNIVAGESPSPPSTVGPDGMPALNTNGSNSITDITGDKSSTMSAKEAVLSAGAMIPLLNCLDSNPTNLSLQRIGSWALSNLVETKIQQSKNTKANGNNSSINDISPASEIDINMLLPTLRRLLNSMDHEVLSYTCWALSHLCDGPSSNIAAVVTSTNVRDVPGGLVPRLVDLLLHDIWRVTKPALRTIGNIVCAECGEDGSNCVNGSSDNPAIPTDFTEVILDCEAVPRLKLLISHENREIQKEACWTLSNIAAGTVDQIQAVIDSEAIAPLVQLVNNKDTDQEVRSEACWVVLNATSCGSDQQIEVLVSEGCVSVLGLLLEDTSMVSMALEGLERVLQVEEHREATRRVRAQMRRSSNLDSDDESEEDTLKPLVNASLIKKALENHNSSAVLKRAERIWNNHFVHCKLCRQSYSKHRTSDAKFCNECKCYVCSKCDCEVYHLSYQEELWAASEEKKAASKRAKKSKRQKKKEKRKGKNKTKQQEVKANDQSDVASQTNKGMQEEQKSELESDVAAPQTPSSENDETKSIKKAGGSKPSTTSKKKKQTIKKEKTDERNKTKPSPQSPSVVSVEEDEKHLRKQELEDAKNSQPPIDFVLYLQQTGSIIALDKLMGAFYEGEGHLYDDDTNFDKLMALNPQSTTS